MGNSKSTFSSLADGSDFSLSRKKRFSFPLHLTYRKKKRFKVFQKSKSLNIPVVRDHDRLTRNACSTLERSDMETSGRNGLSKSYSMEAEGSLTKGDNCLMLSSQTEECDDPPDHSDEESSISKLVEKVYVASTAGNNAICHRGLSDTSLNSDDLMLTTDVNLDQADDDINKDFLSSEKEDPFLKQSSEISDYDDPPIIRTHAKELDRSVDVSTDDSERKDEFQLDDSQSNSTSRMQRRSVITTHSGSNHSSTEPRRGRRRPHSLSNPCSISPAIYYKSHQNELRHESFKQPHSLLPSQQSIDDVFSINAARNSCSNICTWIRPSETASISQDLSGVRLMLLKLRKILIDQNTLENTSSSTITSGTVQSQGEISPYKHWQTLDRDELITELHSLYRTNLDLNNQLKEKDRIIGLIKGHNYYSTTSKRLMSVSRLDGVRLKLNRSQTFDEACVLKNSFQD